MPGFQSEYPSRHCYKVEAECKGDGVLEKEEEDIDPVKEPEGQDPSLREGEYGGYVGYRRPQVYEEKSQENAGLGHKEVSPREIQEEVYEKQEDCRYVEVYRSHRSQ